MSNRNPIHYANPDETCFTGATYEFHFGAYLDTVVRVFHKPDHVEKALELAAEWLAEHEPGHFSEPDYADACAKYGLEWPLPEYYSEGVYEKAREYAERDHIYTEAGWLLSHEWTVYESEGEPFATPTFDRFDVCHAHASYWAAHHQGQWSQGYADLCRATALCTNAVLDFDALSENGQALYRQLVLRDGR
jgi:hypothetical protein